MVRLANAAELAGKSLEFLLYTGTLVWGGTGKSGYWPEDIPEAFETATGLNYDDTIKDIQANPDKYDAVWQKQQLDFYATGHAGVPNMSFNGEPFFRTGSIRLSVLPAAAERADDARCTEAANGHEAAALARRDLIGRNVSPVGGHPRRWRGMPATI